MKPRTSHHELFLSEHATVASAEPGACATAFVVAATVGFLLQALLVGSPPPLPALPLSTAAGAGAAAPPPPPPLPDKALVGTQLLMERRVCGSPATDGYAHVNASCLRASPAAAWHAAWVAAGGARAELVVHLERAADYDGVAVRWGIGHKQDSAEACARACLAFRPEPDDGGELRGAFAGLPCNAFSFCDADVCWEPDAHAHTRGDCWLKFTEAPAAPEVNMRGRLPAATRARHAAAPARTPWSSGVLLPPGVLLRNGSFSPRHWW